MFRLLFPMLVASGIVLIFIWFLSDAARALGSRRRRGQLGSGRPTDTGSALDEDVRRSRRSLIRAREARVYAQVTSLLQQPDLDLLPQRQVADVLTAVEDLREYDEADDHATGPAGGRSQAHESAVAHAELVVAAASRDLRAARLAGGCPDGASP